MPLLVAVGVFPDQSKAEGKLNHLVPRRLSSAIEKLMLVCSAAAVLLDNAFCNLTPAMA